MIKWLLLLFALLVFIGCAVPDDWLWCVPLNTPIIF